MNVSGDREILFDASNLIGMAREGAESLKSRTDAPLIYGRGNELVRIVCEPSQTVRNLTEPKESLRIINVSLDYARAILTDSATWLRNDGRSKKPKPSSCPDVVARTMLSLKDSQFPPLRGISECPLIRTDGTLLQKPGYDHRSHIFYAPGNEKFEDVPNKPSTQDVIYGLSEFDRTLSEFPFVSGADKSVAMAAILTAVARPSLPTVPAFGVTAPSPASGKTALAQLPSMISCGRPAAVMQYSADETETGKALLSVFLEGASCVLLDNVEVQLKSAALCGALTSESYSGRVLGTNSTASVPNCALFIATGNNLSVAGDLVSRTLMCHLNCNLEKPESRKFSKDIDAYVRTNRASLVWSALVIMRARIVSGERVPVSRPWNRFPEWSALVRESLIWAGCDDPCAGLDQLQDDDPERMSLMAVLESWHRVFAGERKRVADLLSACLGGATDLRDALLMAVGKRGVIEPKQLGWWLRRNANRPVSGYRLSKSGERSGVALWVVEKCE